MPAPLHARPRRRAPGLDYSSSAFQIADNLYYVGSRDLASYLITTPAGNILINANSSPPLHKSAPA